MERLWAASGPLAVRDVAEALRPARDLAYTTVLTVMERLFRKGMLTRVQDGRAFRYSPARSKAEHVAALMADALADSGDPSATLVRFADQVSPDEAAELLRALRRRGRG